MINDLNLVFKPRPVQNMRENEIFLLQLILKQVFEYVLAVSACFMKVTPATVFISPGFK